MDWVTKMHSHEMIHGTAKENLDVALSQEEMLRSMDERDPYYTMAKVNVEYYLDCAALLERGEKFVPLKITYFEKLRNEGSKA